MRRSAFSLVELSIVLVILGLLVGGILAGQSLIHAAELRSVAVDMDKYRVAMYAFRDKYRLLPGDINNADSFWPSCVVDPLNASNVCNGNANGAIGAWSTEGLRAWQHLSLAGLVEGNYTGIGDGVIHKQTPGVNTPLSRFNQGGFMVIHESSTTYGQNGSTNAIWFAGASTTALGAPLLKAEDAYNIDRKGDDGVADKGKIFAVFGNGWDKTMADACLTGNKADTAGEYILSATGISCRLTFWLK